MNKIKRNEPCPCGSGKKYKKCCGDSSVTEVDPKLINDELNRLHVDLISFAMNKYKDKIKAQTELHKKTSLQNDEMPDVYNTGLTLWIIFNVPCLENGQTIFDVFYSNNYSKIANQTKLTLAKWSNATPSIYEVISIDRQTKRFVTVKAISTNESFHIPFHEENDFLEGSFIIGTLVPFANYHTFLFTMIKLYRHDKTILVQLLKQYSKKNGGLIKHFPDFLADTFTQGVDAYEWSSPSHEMVAQRFAENMVDKDMDEEVILKGIALWNQYCEKENPSFKKVESYAASLEYLVQSNSTVTQSQLAKEYGVSPVTVSTNFRKLNVFTNDL